VEQLAGVHVPEKTTAPLKSMVATCPAPVLIFRTGGGGSALATVAKPIINVTIRNAIRNLNLIAPLFTFQQSPRNRPAAASRFWTNHKRTTASTTRGFLYRPAFKAIDLPY
jgi:hypothetical protein